MRGRLLYLCVGGGGTDLAPTAWHLPRRRAHWHRRHADDARVGGSGVRMTDGHPGRKSRGSETGNHQISCRIASVPQSTASHTSSSARRCHRARLCGRCHGAGARSWGWRTGGWAGSARRADRREIVVCGRGECVGGRGEGLDSPGGRIGVSLLTGAKFGDRMKKIFPEFFVLDFMRTEKFREHIV